MNIIGRIRELEILNSLYESNRPELLVIYGRRRVGKTFLIEEYFKRKETINFIKILGMKNRSTKVQIKNCLRSIHSNHGLKFQADDWSDIFFKLEKFHKKTTDKRFVLFIDELPWLNNRHDNFLSALEYSWNNYFESTKNCIIVLCGSAASWMINKVVANKGGLHARLTQQILLQPFTLQETEQYLLAHGFNYHRKDIVDLYMTLGGIPKYLSFLSPNESLSQNISKICFSRNGQLTNEFHDLYDSLFGITGPHIPIIKALFQKKQGLSISELSKKIKIPIGKKISVTLDELEKSGFISTRNRYKQVKREQLYQLTDYFSSFYLKWMKNLNSKDLDSNPHFWQQEYSGQSWKSWSGFTFERVCIQHLSQIKKARGISGVTTHGYYWNNPGVQVDFLLERADNVIDIIEIKYYADTFSIDKSYFETLQKKIQTFQEKTKTKCSVMLVLIASFGLKKNNYSNIVQESFDLNILF